MQNHVHYLLLINTVSNLIFASSQPVWLYLGNNYTGLIKKEKTHQKACADLVYNKLISCTISIESMFNEMKLKIIIRKCNKT